MRQLVETPRKSRRRRWIVALILFAIPTILLGRWLLPPPKLKISKETTFITQPLLPNGNPDYVTALNQEWSRGVRPENNALIPLLEAIGPGMLVEGNRDQYYQLLGISGPPLEGDYLVEFDDFIENRPEAPDQNAKPESDELTPFTAEERPLTAAWIAASAGPAEKLHEASTRTRFFVPMLAPQGYTSLFTALLPQIQPSRAAARLLSKRSMLRLGTGDIDRAIDDAIACLRLGRLMGQPGAIIGKLVGIAIYGVGCSVSEQILLSPKLTLEQAQRFRTELSRLPPAARIEHAINWGERTGVLQALVERVDMHEIGLEEFSGLDFLIGAIDLNFALPVINAYFDEAVAAFSDPDLLTRVEKLKTFEKSFGSSAVRKWNVRTLVGTMIFKSRASASKEIGQFWIGQFAPSVVTAQTAEDRATIKQILLETAAAVAAFRVKSGEYPQSLQQLVPGELESVPLDPYSRQPLNYQRHANGFLLYSIGPNGVDEGGRDFRNEPLSPRPDDIRFGRLPPDAGGASDVSK